MSPCVLCREEIRYYGLTCCCYYCAGQNCSAFCFYSPLKSFILLTESEQDKVGWTTDIRDCIERNLRGQTHPRRASVRSELLVDNDDDSSSGYELEGGFVIKNGWLNVSGGAVAMASGPSPSPTTSSSVGKKPRRLWITLTLQTISLGSTFKSAQPEETIPIELCEVAPLKNEKCFRLQFLHDTVRICPQLQRGVTSTCTGVVRLMLTHRLLINARRRCACRRRTCSRRCLSRRERNGFAR